MGLTHYSESEDARSALAGPRYSVLRLRYYADNLEFIEMLRQCVIGGPRDIRNATRE